MPYLTGTAFGLADIAYVPWVLRARDLLGVSLEPYPSLVDWLARLAERPSIQAELEVDRGAVTDVTRDELAARLGEEGLTLLDVRTLGEYDGSAGYPCDARQGHIPGARHVDLQELLAAGDSSRDPSARRTARGRRGDRLLPLGRPLRDGRAAARGGGLHGAQLRRLLARVVGRRGAPDRAPSGNA